VQEKMYGTRLEPINVECTESSNHVSSISMPCNIQDLVYCEQEEDIDLNCDPDNNNDILIDDDTVNCKKNKCHDEVPFCMQNLSATTASKCNTMNTTSTLSNKTRTSVSPSKHARLVSSKCFQHLSLQQPIREQQSFKQPSCNEKVIIPSQCIIMQPFMHITPTSTNHSNTCMVSACVDYLLFSVYPAEIIDNVVTAKKENDPNKNKQTIRFGFKDVSTACQRQYMQIIVQDSYNETIWQGSIMGDTRNSMLFKDMEHLRIIVDGKLIFVCDNMAYLLPFSIIPRAIDKKK
jgi:hypothetical protein